MVAQNIGAEKFKRVPKVMLTAFAIGAVITVIFGTVTLAVPRFVFGLFTSDEEVLDMAMQFVPVALLLFGSCSLRPPANAIINGSGNSKLNLTIAILDGIILRIGFDMFLGLVCNWGIKGFWYGNAFASYTPFVIGMIFFMTGRWKTRKHIVGND